jgi:SAM-dependent methyltransferase
MGDLLSRSRISFLFRDLLNSDKQIYDKDPAFVIIFLLLTNDARVFDQSECFMGGSRISWVQRARSAREIWRDYRDSNRENVDAQIKFHRKLAELIRTRVNRDLTKVRILEIGCGQRASQTILFQAQDAHVIGIDREIPTYHLSLKRFCRIIKINGWERALKSWVRHVFFDRQFFRELSRQVGQKLPPAAVNVCVMDAAHLSCLDDSFDFIFSSLVFEHIADVPAAVAEVNRVLRPEGTAWINIHLFPSLSGGHNKDWTDARKWPTTQVPPWDHLRENLYPADNSLNKLRLGDYRRIFAESLEVIEESLVFEGEQLLTRELETELGARGYPKEDLLTREVAFRCRKRRAGAAKGG